MSIKKSIQLTTKPLEELMAKGEGIDFRLDEDAWTGLNEGDLIEFWEDFTGWQTEPSENSRRVQAKIRAIIRAKSFAELIDTLPEEFKRHEDKDTVLEGLRQWWTAERERETGVLGFDVEVV